MSTNNNSIFEIILASSVVSSLVTWISNHFITKEEKREENKNVVTLEREQHKNRLLVFRYSKLYQLLLDWQKYDQPFDNVPD